MADEDNFPPENGALPPDEPTTDAGPTPLIETFTENYGWTKPEVGASTDVWGDMLNADLDDIDAQVHLNETGKVSKAGDTMTGRLTIVGAGASFSNNVVTDPLDLTKHLMLYDSGGTSKYGFNVSTSALNAVAQGVHISTFTPTGLQMAANKDFITNRDPISALHAANKRYVDARFAIAEMGVEMMGVFSAADGTIRWHSDSGQTGNSLPTPTAAMEGQYIICAIGGSVPPGGADPGEYKAGDWLICNGVDAWYHIDIGFDSVWAGDIDLNPAVAGADNVQAGMEALEDQIAAVDAEHASYVLKAGDNMTGLLRITRADGATVLLLAGATKAIRFVPAATHFAIEGVDQTGVGSYQKLVLNGSTVEIAGGRDLVLGKAPTADLHATTKLYVDGKISGQGPFLPLAGGTLTGALNLSPNGAVNLTHFTYTDTSYPAYSFNRSRGAKGAPTPVVNGDVTGAIHFYGWGGTAYKSNISIQAAVAEPTPGDTKMGGKLNFLITPPGAAGVIAAASLSTTAFTMHSAADIVTSRDPTAPLHATNKRYVDALVSAVAMGVELYGVFDASNGTIRWHSNTGLTGNTLPPPANPDLEGKYIICAVGGTVPPAGAPVVEEYKAGDWLICNGVDAWYHIDIGFDTLSAGDVNLNPAVAGADNVQDGMEALAAEIDGVQAAQGNYLPLSGGTVTGPLYMRNPAVQNAGPTLAFRGTGTQAADEKIWDLYMSSTTGDFAIRSIKDDYSTGMHVLQFTRNTGWNTVTVTFNGVTTFAAGATTFNGGITNKNNYVQTAGTMNINPTSGFAGLYLNTATPGLVKRIHGSVANILRWVIDLGDATPEGATGKPADWPEAEQWDEAAQLLAGGTDFDIRSYDNAGTFIGSNFKLTRSTRLATFGGGIKLGTSNVAPTAIDLSKHLDLYGGTYGLNVTGSTLNIVAQGNHIAACTPTGITMGAAKDIFLNRDPTANMHVTNKRYVDELFAAVAMGVELYGVFDATLGTIRWHSNTGLTGNALPAPTDPDLEGKYIICAVGGSVPPAGADPGEYKAGDWLICNGIDAWYHIDIGFDTLSASDITLNPTVLGNDNVQDALEELATGAFLPLTGGTLTGPLTIVAPENDTAGAITIGPNWVVGGEEGKIRFKANFIAANSDHGARYVASIRAGMTSAWATEYLDFYVNDGTANDAQSDAKQSRVARLVKNSTYFYTTSVSINAPTNNALFYLNGKASGSINRIHGQINGQLRWTVDLGDGLAEGILGKPGPDDSDPEAEQLPDAEQLAAGGSDFKIMSFDNAGAALATPFKITRSNGNVITYKGFIAYGGSGIAPIVIDGKDTGYADIWFKGGPAGGGKARWLLRGTVPATSETGGNVGSDFSLTRYNDAGAIVDAPFIINRANARVTMHGPVYGGSFVCNVNRTAATQGDVSGHLMLWNPGYGLSVTSGTLNVVGGSVAICPGGNQQAVFNGSGLTMTGASADILLKRDPTSPLHAVTKQYVDSKVLEGGGSVGNYLPLTGGTLTGNLDINITTAGAWSAVSLRCPVGSGNVFQGWVGGVHQWDVLLGGGDAGNTFYITRYDNAGAYSGTPLQINRSTGASAFEGTLYATQAISSAAAVNATGIMSIDGPGEISTQYRINGVMRAYTGVQATGSAWFLAITNDAGAYVNTAISVRRSDLLTSFAGAISANAINATSVSASSDVTASRNIVAGGGLYGASVNIREGAYANVSFQTAAGTQKAYLSYSHADDGLTMSTAQGYTIAVRPNEFSTNANTIINNSFRVAVNAVINGSFEAQGECYVDYGIRCSGWLASRTELGWDGNAFRGRVDSYFDLGNVIFSNSSGHVIRMDLNSNGYMYGWVTSQQVHWQYAAGMTVLDRQDADDDALAILNTIKVKKVTQRIKMTDDTAPPPDVNWRFALLQEDVAAALAEATPNHGRVFDPMPSGKGKRTMKGPLPGDKEFTVDDTPSDPVNDENETDLRTEPLMAAMVKAIQQLSAQNVALMARVEQLEAVRG